LEIVFCYLRIVSCCFSVILMKFPEEIAKKKRVSEFIIVPIGEVKIIKFVSGITPTLYNCSYSCITLEVNKCYGRLLAWLTSITVMHKHNTVNPRYIELIGGKAWLL